MRKFTSVNELVNTLKPESPVYCIRPNSVRKSVEFFKNNFPGKVLYAVKTNPNEKIIKIINCSSPFVRNCDLSGKGGGAIRSSCSLVNLQEQGDRW